MATDSTGGAKYRDRSCTGNPWSMTTVTFLTEDETG